ncbi:MAG: hypothetical protein ACKOSQ_10640 [Planctomycetaceae bacterium]
MDAIIRFGSSKTAGLAGSLISVALVLCGASGRAEGITQFGLVAGEVSGLAGGFSSVDLEQLEHATAAEATAARLAAFGAELPGLKEVRSSKAGASPALFGANADMFPHSSRLLPLLVAGPAAAIPVATVASSLRSGLARPVGVPVSSLRTVTSAGR